MMKRFLRQIFVLVTLMTMSIASILYSEGDDIISKRSELSKLRAEIERYESKIKEKEQTERVTLDLLDTYDHQATLLRRLIKRLHEEAGTIEQGIDSSRRAIEELGGQLVSLKSHYAQYIASSYRHGSTFDIELLLRSKSLNQMLIRAEYLKRFSVQRKNDIDTILSKKESVEFQTTRLQHQLEEQKKIISEKNTEESKLATKVKKRKGLLTSIRKDKKLLQQEVVRRVEAAKEMEKLISKLIEQDRIKKEREAALLKNRKTTAPTVTGTTFDDKRGRLRWPVAQGKLLSHFGNQQHPVLKTITQNTGIDIGLPNGSDVKSIAEGEVSMIYYLPPYGNLIILNHYGGFRTVYAHLSEISVNEGDKITEGGQLGKSGESVSGPMLHFEIWKDRDKQDPEQWLSPRGLAQH